MMSNPWAYQYWWSSSDSLYFATNSKCITGISDYLCLFTVYCRPSESSGRTPFSNVSISSLWSKPESYLKINWGVLRVFKTWPNGRLKNPDAWFNYLINSSCPSGGNTDTKIVANDRLADASTRLMVTLLNRGSLLSKSNTSESRLCTNELRLVFPDVFIFSYYNFV